MAEEETARKRREAEEAERGDHEHADGDRDDHEHADGDRDNHEHADGDRDDPEGLALKGLPPALGRQPQQRPPQRPPRHTTSLPPRRCERMRREAAGIRERDLRASPEGRRPTRTRAFLRDDGRG